MRKTHAALLTLAVLLAACATEPVEEQAAQDPGPPGSGVTVATTLYPFAWLAEEIAPGADTRLLADDVAADPHDFELSPSEMQRLLSADIVIHVGRIGYQPQVERVIDDAAGAIVAAIDFVDPLPLAEVHDHDHDHEHEHEQDHVETEDIDPHVWQSPAAMASIAAGVAEAFGAVDVEHRDTYTENADRVASELLALEDEIDGALTACAQETAIVSHAGYAYLLTPRGIDQESITGPEGHGEPSPRRLAEVTRRIRDLGGSAILTEPVEGRRGAEALARDTGAPLVEIHPIGTVTPEQAARGYPALLRENVEAVAAALGCSGAGP